MPKHKVIVYASQGQKKLIGEGTIEKVEFLYPEDVLDRYKGALFLKEDEFLSYATRRKEMLTLTLNNLVRYHTPINYPKPMTMAGQYISLKEYNALMKNATT